MISKYTFFALLSTLLLSACGSSSSSSTRYVDPHRKAHLQMHGELYQEELNKELNKIATMLEGNYKGTIPCADCEGIEIDLYLSDEFTYELRKSYKGKPGNENVVSGGFTLQKDWVIHLDENAGEPSYFKRNGDQFMVLDKNGKVIPGDLGKSYVLTYYEKD